MDVINVIYRRTLNEVLDYIARKYNFDFGEKPPFYIKEGRDGLARLFKEFEFKIGAEIGVQAGNYSVILCQTIPGLKLYGIDSWAKYDGYNDVKGGQDRQDLIYEQAKSRMAPFNCQLIKKWSVDAARDFEDNSLDFVYIDGNHDFSHCTEDVAHWSQKVRKGGIISGHDFLRCNRNRLRIHVQDVINGWTASYGISPWFVFNRDEFPSWMWVKS